MNDAPAFASRHPVLRRVVASARAARAIERTAFHFTYRPQPGQPQGTA